MDPVSELEVAILARANRLASEYKERAERSRDNILRDASDKLHLREQREVLVAKAQAERAYRRKVQANELKFHKEMDHLRWNLVEGVRERLTERIKDLVRDPQTYHPLLKSLLAKGAGVIERDELVIVLNARDLEQLRPIWDEFAKEAVPAKKLTLSPTPIDSLGGLLVQSTDNRIRVNNTFEGRLERLGSLLHQIIIERLLPGGRDSTTIGAG